MRVGPAELLDAARGRRVLLTGPADPDGDSLGACLALQRAFVALGIGCDVTGATGWRYADLPGATGMIADGAVGAYDVVVILDGDCHRLAPGAGRAFAAAAVRAIVDHHGSTSESDYTHAWLDPHATSACAMVAEAMRAWGVALDADTASLLYAGTIFDTGGFRHGNTRPDTHRFAAELLEAGADHVAIGTRILAEHRPCGLLATARAWASVEYALNGRLAIGYATREVLGDLEIEPGDLEGVVDGLVTIVGVEVGALIVERAPGRSKISLRSRGAINVAEVAQRISTRGGGHPRAAGASVDGSATWVRERLRNEVAKAFGG